MPTMEEYAKQPAADRMKRLTRTADELAAAIRGRDDAILVAPARRQELGGEGGRLPPARHRGDVHGGASG